jgi:hypothetical protein
MTTFTTEDRESAVDVWEAYKNDCTTDNLVKIAKKAGFVCKYDPSHDAYSITGHADDLRRFYQMTAGQILLDELAREARELDLYNEEKLRDNG